MLHSMTIRLIYVHLLEHLYLCQMPTRGHLGPNLDFEVNCNISFVLNYKIFRQDLCRSNGTTALVILPAQPQDLILLQFLLLLLSSSYPAGAAAGSYIASVSSSYPAGAAAGSYIASVSSSSSSFFFFFFFLSTSLFLLQLTWYDHVTQVIFISLMTATKLMGLEIHLGSFGVTGVKKVNHVKNMKTALI